MVGHALNIRHAAPLCVPITGLLGTRPGTSRPSDTPPCHEYKKCAAIRRVALGRNFHHYLLYRQPPTFEVIEL